MPRDLSPLLEPACVAVVGASEDSESYGARVWRYLRRDFQGTALAVNRRPGAVTSTTSYQSLNDIPQTPDVVVLATPSSVLTEVLREAGVIGVRAAIVLAREALTRERELLEIADEYGMLLLGPNCLGLINANTSTPLSSSISLERPLIPGPFALVSQSGAIMGTLHAKAADLGIPLGLSVSTGSQAQLSIEDFLDHIVELEDVDAVAVYLEDFDRSRFAAAAQRLREVGKPLIVLKGGVTRAGSMATASHSLSLASDGLMFRKFASDLGSVMVDDMDELLPALLAAQTRGPRLFVAAVSGGLGANAADQAQRLGLSLPEPSSRTTRALHDLGMPSLGNPLDLDATPSTAQQKSAAIAELVNDRKADCVVCIINDMPDLSVLMADLASVAEGAADRLIVCSASSEQAGVVWHEWSATGHRFVEGVAPLLRAFAAVHRGKKHRKETTTASVAEDNNAVYQVSAIEVVDMLSALGIESLHARYASSEEDALDVAARLGYPVTLKVVQGLHRGVAGVRPRLASEEEVIEAYQDVTGDGKSKDVLIQPQASAGLEFYVGVVLDPRFGPLVMVGRGGEDVERARDVSVSPCPVTPTDAWNLITQTTIGRWLFGDPLPATSRDMANLDALARLTSQASNLPALIGPTFRTLDLNPVVVGPSGAVVVDGKLAILKRKPEMWITDQGVDAAMAGINETQSVAV